MRAKRASKDDGPSISAGTLRASALRAEHLRVRSWDSSRPGLSDLSPLKSVGLHKLEGERRNQCAMSVNARWRICFEFRNGDAYEVESVVYHKG